MESLKIEHVKTKIIISGDVIEYFKYSKGYKKGFKKVPADEIVERPGSSWLPPEDENDSDSRTRAMQRAKSTLRRLINANHGQYGSQFTSKFLTLTFGDNITDVKYANYEFTKFIKRLNYAIFNSKKSNIRYNVVIQFQDRGAVHYHIILYNIPFTMHDRITDIWGHGHIWINKIDDVDNVGAYMTEYMGKDIEDTRLEKEKSYFSSRGLFKPTVITDEKTVDTLLEALPLDNMVYSSTFENEYLGDTSYAQYNLKRLVLPIVKSMTY